MTPVPIDMYYSDNVESLERLEYKVQKPLKSLRGSQSYNDGVALQIVGKLDEIKIRSAISVIVQRPSILRAIFGQERNAQAFQQVIEFSEKLFEIVFSQEQLDTHAAQERAAQIFSQPFDLLRGPPLRVALLSSESKSHILVIFLREFTLLYQGQALPPPPQYFECISSSQQTASEKLSALVAYLDSVPQSISFPHDFVRPEKQSFRHARSVHFEVESHVVSRLIDASGGTSTSCLLTAFAAAIHLFAARQTDFAIGVPFTNRPDDQTAAAIGSFANLLPLRVELEDISSLSGLHRAISRDLSFVTKRQDVPLDKLLEALGLNPLSSSDPLIHTSFTVRDAPEGRLDDQTSFSRLPLNNGSASADLACFVELCGSGLLGGELEYDSDIFAHENMASFASAFVRILEAWSAQPEVLIKDLVFVDNGAHVPSIEHRAPTDCSFGGFLASLARPHWSDQAVHDDTTQTSYTYRELYSRATYIQNLVRPHKKDEGTVVLLLERNIDVVAAQIGVNLAGMAWVPCDVQFPLARIENMVADADPVCVIAHRRVLDKLNAEPSVFAMPVVLVDGSTDEIELVDNVQVDACGKVAYMIYTSWSTGKPKGIVIGQESIVAHIVDVISWTKHDRKPFHCVLSTNVAWDASLNLIYPALSTGGCVKIPKIGGENDGEYLSTLMKSDPPTNFSDSTSAALRMWLDQVSERRDSFFPDRMRQIVLGGDELTTTFVRRVFADVASSRDVEVRHIYGPTEGTVLSSYGILTHSNLESLGRRRRVPIDMAMPHAAMTIIGGAGNELPRGFVGEIVIWGTCLLLEYRNLPEVNASRFLSKDGVRGWRSGDFGRHLPNGEFEILGRMDSMCKVRGGFRVELSEIEAHVRSHSIVDDCYVTLFDLVDASHEGSEKRIVAHVVFKKDVQQGKGATNDWKQMVPDYVVPIAALPLTSSHKINKAKLPTPSSTDRFLAATSSCQAWSAEDEGRRPLVEAILKIFSSVLFIDKPLSPKDDFYLCGGHSLVATKATSLICREFGVELPFTAIISSPSASDLAARVEALQQQFEDASRAPNIIPLQSKPVPDPKAMLFVLPFASGELDMMPEVINGLDGGALGLATYGLVWEPNQDLRTLEKIATAYAKSISAIAESTLCFLVGWCYGGMLANEVARRLPKDTTKVILLNSPALADVCRIKPKDLDHPITLINYVCNTLDPEASNLEATRNQTRDTIDRAKLVQPLVDAKIDRHDAPGIVSFIRKHIELPDWVTDSDLNRHILPLADNFDVFHDIYDNHSSSSFDTVEMEAKVILNLQYHTVDEGLTQGLGWTRYELVGTGDNSHAYLAEVSSRMKSALRENIRT